MFSAQNSQVSSSVNYIEDVFSTYLYVGTGATQSITNNIDLSTKGGMVWIKNIDGASRDNLLFDTVRGAGNGAVSNSYSTVSDSTSLSSFNTTGFSLGAAASTNTSAVNFRSWSFRQQKNFFIIKTVTKSGSTPVDFSDLGTIGCIIARKDSTGEWGVWHISATGIGLALSNTSISAFSQWFNVSGTTATMNSNATDGDYTLYGFAHNAGGFGLAGTDNVISCGSYTGTGTASGPDVTLGFEPQWLMIRTSTGFDSDWTFIDNMRGLPVGGPSRKTQSNTTAGDTNLPSNAVQITPTGFSLRNSDGNVNGSATYIYMAIRRGPMKVPTNGTSVLGINARTGTGLNATVTGGAGVSDLALIKNRGTTGDPFWANRLTNTGYLLSTGTSAETSASTTTLQARPWDVMDGIKLGTTDTLVNASANTYTNYLFKRAPSFFDVVCWTTIASSSQSVSHNLGVIPELMIVKSRSSAVSWYVYSATTGNSGWIELNAGNTAGTRANLWGASGPTSTTFTFDSSWGIASGQTVVTYLFATCAGVSKVGSYTGTGSTQTILCGFTGGARFVMIKRTDSTGDWWIWDTTRGMVAGTDPRFALDLASAETNANWVYTTTGGFQIVTTDASVNASGGTYIFLAIA